MIERYEVCLAGSGGQGLIFAGIVLAEAAGIYGGRQVCQSQVYGIVSRGGQSRSELVISDSEIDFPEVERQDLLVALSQEAYDRFSRRMKPGGAILIDPDLVRAGSLPDVRTLALPLARLALESAGSKLSANVVALGAVSALTALFPVEDLQQVLRGKGGARMENNLQALEIGRAAALAIVKGE